MKKAYVLIIIAMVFGLASSMPGCGGSGSSSSRASSPSSGAGTTPTGGGTTPTGGNGGGSSTGDTENDANTGMFIADDMFSFVNAIRTEYLHTSDDIFDGYPWKGEYTDTRTWSVTMTRDDALFSEAQAEANALKSGGSPKGERFGYQNGGGEPFWAQGLDSPKYMISGKSSGSLDGNLYGRWHTKANGTARMGYIYQTGTGSYNKKNKLGVGKADVGDNDVWWVLIFGE